VRRICEDQGEIERADFTSFVSSPNSVFTFLMASYDSAGVASMKETSKPWEILMREDYLL
jgi:hypothetical protein